MLVLRKAVSIFTWPIMVLCAAYVPAVYYTQRRMRDRASLNVKTFAIWWNVTLSVLSAVGFVIMLVMDGRNLIATEYRLQDMTKASRYAIVVFTLSKPLEFVDTFLLVVKKKPVIFLHVYHHFTVCLYCWHALYCAIPFGHLFAFINMGIHAIMYMYYAGALQFKSNRFLRSARPYITLAQLAQMFVGTVVCVVAVKTNYADLDHRWNAFCGLIMYLSYAYLFAHFYVQNYLKNVAPTMATAIATVYVLAAIGIVRVCRREVTIRLILEVLTAYVVSMTVFVLGYAGYGMWRKVLFLTNTWADGAKQLREGREKSAPEEKENTERNMKDPAGEEMSKTDSFSKTLIPRTISPLLHKRAEYDTKNMTWVLTCTAIQTLIAGVYTARAYNDPLLGPGLYACLRWVLEFHIGPVLCA